MFLGGRSGFLARCAYKFAADRRAIRQFRNQTEANAGKPSNLNADRVVPALIIFSWQSFASESLGDFGTDGQNQ